jgi:hypothetical protein
MAKKKNPEQEAPPAEPQEETPQEETPVEEPQDPQEEQPREQDPQEEPAEDPEEEKPGEEEEDPAQDPEETPQEEQQPQDQPGTDDETAQLRSQLLQAQGRLAAYSAGVMPAMVDDAVTLAMAEAAKTGTVTEASVTAAMEAVLKRHPEWKAEEGKKKTAGGFKIGADRDNGGTQKKPGTVQNIKRWNRYK